MNVLKVSETLHLKGVMLDDVKTFEMDLKHLGKLNCDEISFANTYTADIVPRVHKGKSIILLCATCGSDKLIW